ncbi:MAG: hypothetical protein AB8B55_21705 [Mariniblastus sp.]
MINKLFLPLIACVIAFSLTSVASAHDVFQDVLKEKYMLKSFSCKACHPDSDDRKIRTAFAERIHKQLKDKHLEKKFAAATLAEETAKAKDPESVGKNKGPLYDFGLEASKDFEEAFKAVGQETISFDELLKAGLFAGAKLDTKKIKAAKEAAEKEEK